MDDDSAAAPPRQPNTAEYTRCRRRRRPTNHPDQNRRRGWLPLRRGPKRAAGLRTHTDRPRYAEHIAHAAIGDSGQRKRRRRLRSNLESTRPCYPARLMFRATPLSACLRLPARLAGMRTRQTTERLRPPHYAISGQHQRRRRAWIGSESPGPGAYGRGRLATGLYFSSCPAICTWIQVAQNLGFCSAVLANVKRRSHLRSGPSARSVWCTSGDARARAAIASFWAPTTG